MFDVLYQAMRLTGHIYTNFIDFCAERIFYYVETPLFKNRFNQLLFNKYTEILLWIGSVITFTFFDFTQIFLAVEFFAPAIIANAAPPIGKKICQKSNFWILRLLKVLYNESMHLKKLGSHKTWGGFIFGISSGTILAFPIVNVINAVLNTVLETEFFFFNDFVLAFALATAALSGDAIGSRIKRKNGILPGEFVPIDLYGWSFSALLISMLSYHFWRSPLVLTLTALTILPVGASIFGLLAVMLKIKESR